MRRRAGELPDLQLHGRDASDPPLCGVLSHEADDAGHERQLVHEKIIHDPQLGGKDGERGFMRGIRKAQILSNIGNRSIQLAGGQLEIEGFAWMAALAAV